MDLRNLQSERTWTKTVKEIGVGFLLENGDIDYDTLNHLGWKGNEFYVKLSAKYLILDADKNALNEVGSLDASAPDAGIALLSILGGTGVEMLRQRAEFKHQVENVLAVFEERKKRYNYIHKNMVESFNEQLVIARSSYRVDILQFVDFCEASTAERREIWLGKCLVLDKDSGARCQEYFACAVDWDKNGDAKYETNSYDRPIRLEGLWLHSSDYNNYLISKD